jgi:hypothetical protein
MRKLTKLETEIFLHRLSAPDSIVEVLEEDGYHTSDIEAVIAKLAKGELAGAEQINKQLSDAVLIETVEGSTFFGSSLMDQSDQRQRSILRAGNSLAAKIGEYVGRDIEYPSY